MRDALLKARRRETGERKLLAAELKANEAKAHAEARLAKAASRMMEIYRAMLPQARLCRKLGLRAPASTRLYVWMAHLRLLSSRQPIVVLLSSTDLTYT